MDTEPSPPRREFTGVTGAAALRNLKVAATTLRVLMTMNELLWHVAHTRPRCEKKLAEYCGREGLMVTLPCYRTMHKYRGKTVTFQKPLFPGYVFLQLLTHQRQKVYQSDYVANLLDVPDQDLFAQQLGDILLALETDLEVHLAPQISPGTRVKIKSGPLRGLEGWVEQREGTTLVLLRLDFIAQAAAVKIDATELEMI
ncbi:MAG: hypothetical protein DME18_06520 [Verrucomicrobia bacterium]|nr:MAG: hypothetical protein DME18_06520 [Verrucomicrobiota bacterium]